ncbi:D-serine ammonia-lyase [Periweissella cryptocerci]|uniref:Probable D-serine dehydratase n=1 Tax=Periweissella cryptocerci TaxID=2506420 RepID=A0A4P6YW67_9LACO|nr:D-serine ammonia-lyase [Periweissella cryptocerci]QBO37092.1 D-serine ammonia-lyase [Periweissella cryptocerci]
MAIDVEALKATHPILDDLLTYQELFWNNPEYQQEFTLPFGVADVLAATKRFERFAPYLALVFPDTRATHGIIESPLTKIPNMQQHLSADTPIHGQLYLKEDNKMPVSGSIKSRGGLYEVLKYAESLAIAHLGFSTTDDYTKFNSAKFRDFFAQHKIEVASTGNLGLSVGLMASTLGFQTCIHMSKDAVAWKIAKLRANGVEVVVYDDNFSNAVAAARKASSQDMRSYFVDDEASTDLFLGYATAGPRIKAQLAAANIPVDADHPLFVYLPAGVGGSPSGVAFGLKMMFGANVYPIFVEPAHIPSVLVGMETQLNNDITVYDVGIDGQTRADGLAVGRPSKIAGVYMRGLLAGIATSTEDRMFKYLAELADAENIWLEPSSTIGMKALTDVMQHPIYGPRAQNATHIVWATGGSMVPTDIMHSYYEYGRELLARDTPVFSK